MSYVKRYVSSHFWDDNFVVNLDPIEKLLFLYLITNPLTRISGFYEISLKRIAFDTGIDKDMVAKILKRFEDAEKVFYVNGYIVIPNFPRHQAYNQNMKKSIEEDIKSAPSFLKRSKGFQKLLKAFKGFLSLSKIEDEDEDEDEVKAEVEDEANISCMLSDDNICPQDELANVSGDQPTQEKTNEQKPVKKQSPVNRQKIKPCPHKEIIELYHETLPELQRVKVWNDTRRRLLQARWRESPERQDLNWWREFFESVRKSPFLMGQVQAKDGRIFQANLEWLLKPTNFAKVLEGYYLPRGGGTTGKYAEFARQGIVSETTARNLEVIENWTPKNVAGG